MGVGVTKRLACHINHELKHSQETATPAALQCFSLVADRFPRIRQPRTSLSINSQDVSVSESRQLDPSVPASTISNLSSGEFVGIVADDPSQPIALKAFHGRIINDPDAAARERYSLAPLPEVRTVDEATITANHQQIPKDVRDIYNDLMEMLRNDPVNRHLIVYKSGSDQK
jgi:hypothetical protein